MLPEDQLTLGSAHMVSEYCMAQYPLPYISGKLLFSMNTNAFYIVFCGYFRESVTKISTKHKTINLKICNPHVRCFHKLKSKDFHIVFIIDT